MLVNKRSVVELQLIERVFEVVVMRAVSGIDAAVHHRIDMLIAGQRLRRGIVRRGKRVADLRFRNAPWGYC